MEKKILWEKIWNRNTFSKQDLFEEKGFDKDLNKYREDIKEKDLPKSRYKNHGKNIYYNVNEVKIFYRWKILRSICYLSKMQ